MPLPSWILVSFSSSSLLREISPASQHVVHNQIQVYCTFVCALLCHHIPRPNLPYRLGQNCDHVRALYRSENYLSLLLRYNVLIRTLMKCWYNVGSMYRLNNPRALTAFSSDHVLWYPLVLGTIFSFRFQVTCSGMCRMNKLMAMDSYCVQSMRAMRDVNLSEERRERN
jgi:hypothetical protein